MRIDHGGLVKLLPIGIAIIAILSIIAIQKTFIFNLIFAIMISCLGSGSRIPPHQ